MNKKAPIFHSIFAEDWDKLPKIIQKHYANRPYSQDVVVAKGMLDVRCQCYAKAFLWLSRSAPPYNERRVPVTVTFSSQPKTKAFCFHRIFYFKHRKPFHFKSRMIQVKANEMMEIMRYGLCWHLYYAFEKNKVILRHKGYSLYLFGVNIPLPLAWLIGRCDAYETAISDNHFNMCATITHPLLGNIYEYKGKFEIKT